MVYAAAAALGVAVALGAAFAAHNVAQARDLIRSQRLRLALQLVEPGRSPDLLANAGVSPDRTEVRRGPGAGERTEVWIYGRARVTVRFTPAHPKGLVMKMEGRLPAMAWAPGRAPQATSGRSRSSQEERTSARRR